MKPGGTWSGRDRPACARAVLAVAAMAAVALAMAAPAPAQEAGVKVDKSSDATGFVQAGETVTYDITVTNDTNGDVFNVVVRERFDTTELNVISTRGDASIGSTIGSLSWTIAEIGPGEQVSLGYTAQATDVSATRSEITTTTELFVVNRKVDEIELVLRPSFTMTTGPAAARDVDGATLLTKTIEWTATAPVADVEIREAFGFTAVDPASPRYQAYVTVDEGSAVPLGNTLTWRLGTVQAGKGGELRYSVRVDDQLNAGQLTFETETTASSRGATLLSRSRSTTFSTPKLAIVDLGAPENLDRGEIRAGHRIRLEFAVVNAVGTPASGEVEVVADRDPVDEVDVLEITGGGVEQGNTEIVWKLPMGEFNRTTLSYTVRLADDLVRPRELVRAVTLRQGGVEILETPATIAYTVVPVPANRAWSWVKVVIFVLALYLLILAQPWLVRPTDLVRRWRSRPARPAPAVEGVTPPERAGGLALSGGGYRAAAFGLGAVLYLVDSGHHSRLGHVSSVSGGSITNAFVAAKTGFGHPGLDPREFREQIRALAAYLARRSLIRPGLGVVVTLAGLVGLGVVGWWLGVFGNLSRGLVAAFALGAAGVYALYRAFGLAAYGRIDGLLDRADLDRLHTGHALHVLCATDLEWGEHFYLSGEFAYHSRYKRGAPRGLSLAHAVHASAAFPGALPPVPVRRKKLNTAKSAKVPRVVRLVDGGVHDNLGVTWFEIDLATEPGFTEFPPREPHVVVNASAPSVKDLPRLNWAVWADIRAAVRSMEIVHQSNSAARAEERQVAYESEVIEERIGVMVSIDANPFALLDELRDQRDGALPTDAALKEAELRRSLDPAGVGGISALKWADLAEAASPGVRTNLVRLGVDRAAELIYHGYVVTLLQTYSYLGWPPPKRDRDGVEFVNIPTLAEFRRLCEPPGRGNDETNP